METAIVPARARLGRLESSFVFASENCRASCSSTVARSPLGFLELELGRGTLTTGGYR